MRNTRESLDWDEIKAPILTNFCKKMARSGYPESYRTEVIKSGVVGYERQLKQVVLERNLYSGREVGSKRREIDAKW